MSEQNARFRGLYAITPGGLERGVLFERVSAALRGGVRILQYRDKQRAPTEQAEIAQALNSLCRQHGVRFIVNDNLDLALAIDADGVNQHADFLHAKLRHGHQLNDTARRLLQQFLNLVRFPRFVQLTN